MPIETVKCQECGSSDVTELKTGSYVCQHCESVFKWTRPAEGGGGPALCSCGLQATTRCVECDSPLCGVHVLGNKCLSCQEQCPTCRRPLWKDRATCLECGEVLHPECLDTSFLSFLGGSWTVSPLCNSCEPKVRESTLEQPITTLTIDGELHPFWTARFKYFDELGRQNYSGMTAQSEDQHQYDVPVTWPKYRDPANDGASVTYDAEDAARHIARELQKFVQSCSPTTEKLVYVLGKAGKRGKRPDFPALSPEIVASSEEFIDPDMERITHEKWWRQRLHIPTWDIPGIAGYLLPTGAIMFANSDYKDELGSAAYSIGELPTILDGEQHARSLDEEGQIKFMRALRLRYQSI